MPGGGQGAGVKRGLKVLMRYPNQLPSEVGRVSGGLGE